MPFVNAFTAIQILYDSPLANESTVHTSLPPSLMKVPLCDLISNTSKSKISVIVTFVADTLALFVTSIVKLTSPKTSIDFGVAILLTVILIGTTFTSAVSLTTVVFSLHVTSTLFVQLPVATDLAIIQNVTF